ncbi:MAG: putative transport system permease protein [Acidobacteriota bacterium]|jgi:putative ABC transport system permease protein|nr:putative transport system permease protein [Acidobacteriota bacterium]
MKGDFHVILSLFSSSSQLQRKRAFLTIASIAWGTVAILLLLAFGEGLKRQMDKNRRSTGENLAVMWPGETSKAWQGMPPGRPIRPRIDDVDLLRAQMPELKSVHGELTSWRTALQWERKVVNGRVIGAQRSYGESRVHYPVAGGRWINAQDEEQRRRVIFLGDELAKDIFGDTDPVGKTVLVNNAPYAVIGVMQKKTQMGVYGGPDASHAVIPYTTWRAQFGRDKVNVLVIETHKADEMVGAIKRVNQILGKKYGYDPTDDRAFGTWDMVKTSKQTYMLLVGIQMFLGIVGALTLIIGGVGVANIMYAVVKERTREIGVKMALGAKQRWIIWPFVMEGVVYTLIGGALGICIATLVVAAATYLPVESNKVMSFLGRPTLSPQIGVATSAILGIIGLLAGYFPARRAARVDPAATLRYE